MRVLIGGGVLAVIVGATVMAQEASLQPGNSLVALTEEVRLLRMAVEKSTRTQTQLQGMSVYLTAQQSRLLQVGGRVDAIRRDLAAASRESRALAEQVTTLRTTVANETSAEMKAQVEAMLGPATREAARAAEYEQQLRSSEAEASADLQTELARWTDLTGRLDQLIRQ